MTTTARATRPVADRADRAARRAAVIAAVRRAAAREERVRLQRLPLRRAA